MKKLMADNDELFLPETLGCIYDGIDFFRLNCSLEQ